MLWIGKLDFTHNLSHFQCLGRILFPGLFLTTHIIIIWKLISLMIKASSWMSSSQNSYCHISYNAFCNQNTPLLWAYLGENNSELLELISILYNMRWCKSGNMQRILFFSIFDRVEQSAIYEKLTCDLPPPGNNFWWATKGLFAKC